MPRILSIKTLPMVAVGLGISILGVVFLFTMITVINLQNEGFAASVGLQKKLLWDKTVADTQHRMLVAGAEMADDFSLNRALRQDNAELVAVLGEKKFEQLKGEDNSLKNLLILDKQLETRWAKEVWVTGESSQSLLKQSIQDLQPRVSLISQSDNSLIVVGVFPSVILGDLKGVVVLIADAHEMAYKLKEFDSDDYQLESLNGDAIASTFEGETTKIDVGINQSEVLTFDDRYIRATVVAVQVGDNKPIARLAILHDETDLIVKQQQAALVGLGVLLIVSILVVLGVAWLIGRSLHPINLVAEMMETIVGGDLSQELPAMKSKELQQLGSAANAMIAALRGLVGQILDTTSQLRGESDKALAESLQSETSMQDQISHIEEVSQSMTDLSQSAVSLADNIEATGNVVNLVQQEADKGSQQVNMTNDGINQMATVIESVVTAIGDVGRVTEEVGNTLDVLNAITEQTDLLALNAAIEAARAGEYGRGFAVVADEVRNLATLARKSTDNIREIIDGLHQSTQSAAELVEVGKKEAGSNVELVQLTVASFNQVKESTGQIADSNRSVASNAKHQADTAQQVKTATDAIREKTAAVSENASRVSQSAAQIATMAQLLETEVAHFQLNENEATDGDGEVNFF